jgi:ketosteroid isomerase-like protein
VTAEGSPNLAAIAEAHAAFARGDIDGILGKLAPDVEWRIPESLPYGGTYRAPDGVAAFYAALGRHWERYELVLERLVDAGSTVVSVGRFVATGPEGVSEAPFVLVWDLVDGQVVRMQQYTDTAGLLGALGSAGRTEP